MSRQGGRLKINTGKKPEVSKPITQEMINRDIALRDKILKKILDSKIESVGYIIEH